MKSINNEEGAPVSNERDPGTRTGGIDQRDNTPRTKRQAEESETGLPTDSDSETETSRPTEQNPLLDQPKEQAHGTNDDTQPSGWSSPAAVTNEEKLPEGSWDEGSPPSRREGEGSPSRRGASPMDIQPNLPLVHDRDIPSSPRENCLFF